MRWLHPQGELLCLRNPLSIRAIRAIRGSHSIFGDEDAARIRIDLRPEWIAALTAAARCSRYG